MLLYKKNSMNAKSYYLTNLILNLNKYNSWLVNLTLLSYKKNTTETNKHVLF